MNIFEWMHRKLNPSVDCNSKLSRHRKAGKLFKHEDDSMEKELLLGLGQEMTDLHQVLDGFLTIGTLGNGGLYWEDEKEEPKEAESLHVEMVAKNNQLAGGDEPKRSGKGREDRETVVKESVVVKHAAAAPVAEEGEETMMEPLLREEVRERTTLKDLFHESDELDKKEVHTGVGRRKDQPAAKKAAVPVVEGKRSWGKVVPLHATEEAVARIGVAPAPELTSPKKLRRLLRKMTRRKKVHPEAESDPARGLQKLRDEATATSSLLRCATSVA